MKLIWVDPDFRRRWQSLLFQAVLASAVLGLILLLDSGISNVPVFTAIASSTFAVFTRPQSDATRTRRVAGGHTVGVATGLLALGFLTWIGHDGTGLDQTTGSVAAIAVGVSMVAMVITDTEHAPAAGTVLGMIIGTEPLRNAGLLLLGACLLCGVRSRFRPRLTNLTG